jgi:hypothetical protein
VIITAVVKSFFFLNSLPTLYTLIFRWFFYGVSFIFTRICRLWKTNIYFFTQKMKVFVRCFHEFESKFIQIIVLILTIFPDAIVYILFR